MNWTRVVTGGIAAGVVISFADFVMHGVILADAYRRYTVAFSQTQVNPLLFSLIALCIGFTAALLFAKTRGSWAPGLGGGVTFGFFLGLTGFFASFYNPLVINGFPYHLAWCWGGIKMIDCLLAGVVLGAVIKRA